MNPVSQNTPETSVPDRMIPDEWLVAYAAGNLSEAKATLVATHASFHPSLRKKIDFAENVGGAMLEAIEETALSDGFYDRLLGKIATSDNSDVQGSPENTQATNSLMPKPLADYLEGRSFSDLKWRFMGPGMKQVKLWSGEDNEKLWLMKVKGGTEIPEHGHNGHEMTLVLQGSYRVNGHKYGVGDMEIAQDDIDDHRPIIDEGDDCICLVVTEAPIKLKSLVARVMQPFIGL